MRRQGQIASQLQDSKYVPRMRQLIAASIALPQVVRYTRDDAWRRR
jgi:hypothetical protein